MPELPVSCLSFILCDQVIEDVRTHKKSLIGTFNDIVVNKTPANHSCMFILLSLTNCRREYNVEIEISKDTDQGGERILVLNGCVKGKNPLDVIDLVFELRGVPLPEIGKYTIEVKVQPEGTRIAQRSFRVRQMRARKGLE